MTVTVRDRLTRPHPLVAKTQQAAARSKPDDTGRLELGSGDLARLRVSRSALPRTLRILDALCREAEARGWRTEAARRHSGNPCMRFTQGEWDVEFKIVEDTDKSPHVRTAVEEKEAARGYTYGIPQWDHRPNGRLRLVLDSYVAERTNFNDGVRQRLEDILHQVVEAVARAFEIEDEREARREQDRSKKRQSAVLKAEGRYQGLLEKRRRSGVEAQVARWRWLEDLSTYAGGIAASSPEMAPEARQKAETWLAWVTAHIQEGRNHLSTPSLPADVPRDDPSLVSDLGVDFDTWSAWRASVEAASGYSESDGSE